MRNAIICVGTMLAMLLAWPLVVGGGSSAAAAEPRGASVRLLVPPPAPALTSDTVSRATLGTRSALETCSQRYRRVVRVCTSTGCQLTATDALDICEGTGFWPE